MDTAPQRNPSSSRYQYGSVHGNANAWWASDLIPNLISNCDFAAERDRHANCHPYSIPDAGSDLYRYTDCFGLPYRDDDPVANPND